MRTALGPLTSSALAAVALLAGCGGKVVVDRSVSSGDASGSSGDPGATSNQGGGGTMGSGSTGGAGGGAYARLHRCLTLDFEASVQRITLETGEIEVVASIPTPLPAELLVVPPAILADAIYLCTTGVIERWDLAAQKLETTSEPCYAIAPYGTGVLVGKAYGLPFLTYFASYDEIIQGSGQPYQVPLEQTEQFGTEGDVLYTAFHSTNEVGRYALSTGADLGVLHLEGYDTWIRGLDVTPDGLLVLNGAWPEGRIGVLDAATGAALFDVSVPNSPLLSGLACEAVPRE